MGEGTHGPRRPASGDPPRRRSDRERPHTAPAHDRAARSRGLSRSFCIRAHRGHSRPEWLVLALFLLWQFPDGSTPVERRLPLAPSGKGRKPALEPTALSARASLRAKPSATRAPRRRRVGRARAGCTGASEGPARRKAPARGKTTLLGRGVRHLVDLSRCSRSDAGAGSWLSSAVLLVARPPLRPARTGGQSASPGGARALGWARTTWRRWRSPSPASSSLPDARDGDSAESSSRWRSCSSLSAGLGDLAAGSPGLSASGSCSEGPAVPSAPASEGAWRMVVGAPARRFCSVPSPSHHVPACSACPCRRLSGELGRGLADRRASDRQPTSATGSPPASGAARSAPVEHRQRSRCRGARTGAGGTDGFGVWPVHQPEGSRQEAGHVSVLPAGLESTRGDVDWRRGRCS